MDWLEPKLVAVLRWQLANRGRPANSPDAPEIPYAGQRVWGMFLQLHESRGGGGFGASPITYAEMESFVALSREPLRQFEFEIIRALDREYLKFAAGKSEGAGAEPKVESRPMSPALFDAMFH